MPASSGLLSGGSSRFVALPQIVQMRSVHNAHERAFAFLRFGQGADERWTYDEVHRRAVCVARQIQRYAPDDGAPLLLAYPPGLEFVAALIGCMYAGRIPAPVELPTAGRKNIVVPRLLAIQRQSQANVILTDADHAHAVHRLLEVVPGTPLLLIGTESGACTGIDQTASPQRCWHPGDPALIQYSSGSTDCPKGVVISHANLHAACVQGNDAYGVTSADRSVTWVPLHYDMGLVTGIFRPIHAGHESILMPPLAFAERPLRWLQTLSLHAATLSSAPNFGYEQCIDRVIASDLADLNLSAWRCARIAGEPVHASTLRRFAEALAPAGFRWEALCPSYGLAEATLTVTTCSPGKGPLVRHAGASSAGVLELVSSGKPVDQTEVVIVDSEDGDVCSEGSMGELFVSGPQVATSYYRNPELSAVNFGLRLPGRRGSYLRTGDLAVVRDGQLYVAGRAKDVIVARGSKYFPEDIERTVETRVPAIRPGRCMAFGVAIASEERLVVLAETNWTDVTHLMAAVQDLRSAVTGAHGLRPWIVGLVDDDMLPRTSSGKKARQLCRQRFLDGELNLRIRWGDEG